MSVDAEGGARALRGVWAWLRRSQRAVSLESLSSAGSACTAVSFAFVPACTRSSCPPPSSWRRRDLALRPSAPQLPLHIKYGLPLDTSTLPVAPRAVRPARRALSEYGRPAVHVPGKRRAPAPPTPTVFSATVPRRRAHKRPAPRPPSCVIERDENAPPLSRASLPPELMDSPPSKTRSSGDDVPPKRVPGAKLKSEKNFLRNLFENKFRNSVVDPAPTRVLPSISELDREAVALIRSGRERSCKDNEASGSSIYTQTDDKITNERILISKLDEKEKLKEMLKEIKDSLSKRPKHAGNTNISNSTNHSARQTFFENKDFVSETPTLPMAFKDTSNRNVAGSGPQMNEVSNVISEPLRQISRLVTPQIIVMDAMAKENHVNKPQEGAPTENDQDMKSNAHSKIEEFQPMKVSSLFNPLYIPKHSVAGKSNKISINVKPDHSNIISQPPLTKLNAASQTKAINPKVVVPDIIRDTDVNSDCTFNKSGDKPEIKLAPSANKKISNDLPGSSSNKAHILENKTSKFNVDIMSQHSRRRDLVNQLEKSIAEGDERAAADAAVKLAQLRLSCSVLSFTSNIIEHPCSSRDAKAKDATNSVINPFQSIQVGKIQDDLNSKQVYRTTSSKSTVFPCSSKDTGNKQILHHPPNTEPSTSSNNSNVQSNAVSVQVWVEDKEATRGPIQITVPYKATLKDLRQQAEITLGLAVRLQRWIVGNSLCNEDNTSLVTLAGPDFKAPFYLCLVESEPSSNVVDKSKHRIQGDVYTELMELEQRALAPNVDVFECQVCMEQCAPGEGVVLRECVHSFCRNCLKDQIKHSVEPAVNCPATNCPGILQEREVRGLVSLNDYERWLARGLAVAESGTRNTFHCRTPDCKGWAFCETGVKTFPCPVCNKSNCLQCQTIHERQSCEEYRLKLEEIKKTADGNRTDESTKALLASLISRGEALECPECRAIITKKWGCDWIKCSACKTEICWVTRGRRWGPGGRGDTSAGCRCGVDGRRCHPTCGYCH